MTIFLKHYKCKISLQIRSVFVWVILPECLLDAAIVCNVLSLGVDPVQVKDLTIHLHTVVRVLVCKAVMFI